MKSRCVSHKDKHGYHYSVPQELTKSGIALSPGVSIWWNRDTHNKQKIEELILRQENGRVGADVIMLTLGQVYDLIDALNQAVERP